MPFLFHLTDDGNNNAYDWYAQVHGEICALLIEVLESLKTNLTDFSCVLPKQWVGLISATTSNIDPSQRLEQLANRTKVSHPRI